MYGQLIEYQKGTLQNLVFVNSETKLGKNSSFTLVDYVVTHSNVDIVKNFF